MDSAKRGLNWSTSSEDTPRPAPKRQLMEDLGSRIQAALRHVAAPSETLSDVPSIHSIVTAVITSIVPIIVETVEDSVQRAFNGALQDARAEIGRMNDELLNKAWKIDALEQYSRRENIRISGNDLMDDEDKPTNEIVIETCKKMGVEISDRDISTSHWLPGRKPTIIAKFVRRDTKAAVMLKKKNLKKGDPAIFEDLTRARQQLLLEIRSDPNVLRAFTRDGVIHCVLPDPHDQKKELKVRIKDPGDLVKIGWCDDDIRWLHDIFA
jgi:hypothetical protein